MPLRPDRRLFLQTAAAGLIFRPAVTRAAGLPELAVLNRWPTGNTRLNPLTADAGNLLFCGDKTVGAVSLASRTPLWTRPHGFATAAEYRPRAAGPVMVCGGRGWIAGFDASTGDELWRHLAEIQTGVPFVTPSHTLFGDGHRLLALDTATGAELWRFSGIPDTLASYAPTATEDTAFVGPGDGRLYALSLTDGALKWSVDGREPWQYLRHIYARGETLVAGTYREKLVGLSVADGHLLWSFNAGNFINSQHVTDDSAYLWSPTGWVYAIDTGTGAVRWRHQTTDYDETAGNWASMMAELTTLDGRLYALAMDNILHVLDTGTGAEIAANRVPDRIRHAVLPLAGGKTMAFPPRPPNSADGRGLTGTAVTPLSRGFPQAPGPGPTVRCGGSGRPARRTRWKDRPSKRLTALTFQLFYNVLHVCARVIRAPSDRRPHRLDDSLDHLSQHHLVLAFRHHPDQRLRP